MFAARYRIFVYIVVFGAVILLGGFFVWSELQKAKTANEEARIAEDHVLELKKNNTEQNIDTSDWKVYRNEKYGFEVRYPNEWESITDDRDTAEIFDIAYLVGKVQRVHGLGFFYPGEFLIRKIRKVELLPQERNSLPVSFYLFADAYIKNNLKPGADLLETRSQLASRDMIRINAIKFKNNPDAVFVPNITVLIDYSSDSVIWIEGRYFPEYEGKVFEDIEKILSTFRFVE